MSSCKTLFTKLLMAFMLCLTMTNPSLALIPSPAGGGCCTVDMTKVEQLLEQMGTFLGKTVAHWGTLLYGTDMDEQTQEAFYALVGQCVAANISELASRQAVLNNAAARMHYDLYASINTKRTQTMTSSMSRSVPIEGNPFLDQPAAETNSVSMDSIMNTTSINESTAQQARNFISFITHLSEPFQQPHEASEIKSKLGSDQEIQEFVSNLGSFASQTSVGLSNYNYFYYERLVQPGLGAQAGIYQFNADGSQNASMKDASPMQVDEFMAKRRIADPNWYTYMAQLPPAAIQREMVTILAELRYELYKQRLLMERQIATESAMQLSMVHYAASRLVSSEEKYRERIDEPETTSGTTIGGTGGTTAGTGSTTSGGTGGTTTTAGANSNSTTPAGSASSVIPTIGNTNSTGVS